MLNSNVHTAPFKEHLITDISRMEPYNFDVIAYQNLQPDFIINGQFCLKQYCTCLLHKLFLLDKSDIKPFFQYQCGKLIDSLTWLNKFEKLIDLNRHLFVTIEQNIKIEKALVVIELLRQEIENTKINKPSEYDFNVVKTKLGKYSTTEEKLSYLYEAQADYLQNKPRLIDPLETSFDQKIIIEIEKIERLELLKKRVPEKETNLKINLPLEKIQINGHINILVDAFYQMLYEKKSNSQPYLAGNAAVITKLLATCFIDKEGHPLSESTIRTILSPNKPDKRPKGDRRINL